MNNIPAEKRRHKFTEQIFRSLAESVTANLNHEMGTSTSFTAEDFIAWYSRNMPFPQKYLDIDNDDTDPDPPAGHKMTLLHKLSAVCNQARDKSVLAVIGKAFRDHDRVLVVYGASHLGYEWDRLLRIYGTPEYKKPF